MPTLTDLFPNLAKLKKDDASGAGAGPFDEFAARDRSRSRSSVSRPRRPPARSAGRREPTLKVGGPTRSKRSGPRRAPSRDAALAEDRSAPVEDRLFEDAEHGPGAVHETPAPASDAFAPLHEQIPAPDHATDAPSTPERRFGGERRSGVEARSDSERRFGVEARSGRDRRSSQDPRSGEDMRSGADRRRDTGEQSAGFSPLATAARFGIDKLSGLRRPAAPASRGKACESADERPEPADDRSETSGKQAEPAEKQADAGFSPLASAARFAIGTISGGRRKPRAPQRSSAEAASEVATAAGASTVKRSSGTRPRSRGGAPNLAKLGSLGSVKNMNMSLGRRGGRGTSFVGLDIQPGYVAAVEADVNGVVAVKRAVGLALPPDTMRDGEVIDASLLAEVLQELFAKSGLSKRVRVGLANQRTVVRTMELPPIEDRKELAAAVRFQAQDQIPMPLANAVLDFQPLGIVETPAGKRQRVVVVAAQREMVERLVGAVSAAGLRPEAVDLSAFAMIRALYRPEEAVPERSPAAAGPSALGGVDVGGAEADDAGIDDSARAESPSSHTLFLNVGGLTNLAIAEGATCRFTRAVGGGLESMAGALAERRNVPLVDARRSIASFDLMRREARVGTPPGAPVASAAGMSAAPPLPGAPGVDAPTDRLGVASAVQGSPAGATAELEPSAAEVRAVIAGGLREIAGEVRNSLDYHRAQESGGTVATVVVSGAALEINGFASALEAELGFRVQRRSVASSRGGDLNHTPAERLAIAAGLAVEEIAG